MSKYKFNKNIIEFDIYDIPVIGNTSNGSLIGLTRDGINLLQKINNAENLYEEDLTSDQKVLLKTLKENEYIIDYNCENKEKVKLSSAYFHVTNNCNLNCVGCYSYDSKRNKYPDLSFKEIQIILTRLKEMNLTHLIISGGEPFIRNDIGKIVSYAKRDLHFEKISLLTNGTLINKNNLLLVKEFIDEIVVSIDGYDENNSTFIRDQGIFSTIEESINLIKLEKMQISILATLHKKNINKSMNYIKYSEKLDVPINFSLLTCDPECFSEWVPSNEQLEFMGNNGFYGNDIIKYKDNPDNYSMSVRKNCGVGSRILSIGYDGSIYPCHMLHNNHLKFGNLLDSPINKLLNSEKAKIFEKLNVDNINICKDCEYKYVCGGGCRARSYYSTKKICDVDTYCNMNKVYFKNLFEAIAKKYKC